MAREEELELHINGGRNSAKTRIYVGGLGGTVSEDDLRNTFSPLGKLESIQIVRTKNRSFAYLDFLPSSDKSLAKLFSTYNRCIWKGGRLRLEKAKEHYLVRMKREKTEEAELATKALSSNDDLSNNTVSFGKPNKLLAAEKPQLRFFFPKLMKMKSLPFNGTGKHKYSFQRIQVPSHPIHFCDCEEHSNPSEISKDISCVDVEIEHGGINDQEFDMMNLVLNKFLEKNNSPINTGGKSQFAEEKIDKMIVDENTENQADSDDDDNIVINIVKGRNDNLSSYQGFNMNKPQHSTQKAAQKDAITYDKKRKSPLFEESEKTEISAFGPQKKNISKSTSSEPANHTKSTQPLPQKPRWKKLVGKTENTQFSISQILPEVPSSKENERKKSKHGDLENQVGSISDVKEPENHHTKETVNGNSESQLSPFVKVKEPETDNNQGVPDEDLLKNVSLKSQLATSNEVNKVDEASKNNSTSGRGAFWKQKSSWTQLISTTTARSFSISQVLPGLTFESQKATENITAVNTDLKEELSKTFEVAKGEEKNVHVPELLASSSEKKSAKNEGSDKKSMKEANEAEIWNRETCPFMRSEASMKEWVKTKTALCESLKKKGNNDK